MRRRRAAAVKNKHPAPAGVARPGGAGIIAPAAEESRQPPRAGVFVVLFVGMDRLESRRDLFLRRSFTKTDTNFVKRSAAAFRQRDGGALNLLVSPPHLFVARRLRSVEERCQRLRITCPHARELFIFRQPDEIARMYFSPADLFDQVHDESCVLGFFRELFGDLLELAPADFAVDAVM